MVARCVRLVAFAFVVGTWSGCGGGADSNWSPTAPTSTVSSTTLATQTITSLSVSIPTTTLTVGATASVTATATYSNGTTADITPTWTASQVSVVSVSTSGLVLAGGAGTATITAIADGQVGSVVLTVLPTAATLTDITVAAGITTLRVGANTPVRATATYSDGTVAPVSPTWGSSESDGASATARLVWTSSNAAVASVSASTTSDGIVTALAVGATDITGSFEGQNGSVTIDVSEGVPLSTLRVRASGDQTTLLVGESTTVSAEAEYSDGSIEEVIPTWSSSDPWVALVLSDGTVSALAAGMTNITGSYSELTDSVVMTVSEPTIAGLSINASATTLMVGATATTVTATATYSAGTSGPVPYPTWSSSAENVATVNFAGEVAAHNAGTATITGTFGGQSGSVNITVTESDATLTGLAVSAAATSVAVRTTTTVTATASYSDGTSAVVTPTWTSSDSYVATVSDSGTVTGVAAGTVTITATYEGFSDSVVITVNPATATVTGLSLSASATTITVGGTATVTATASYSDGTSATVAPNSVAWASSDIWVATVSDSGTVTGVDDNTVTITGWYRRGSSEEQSATVVITVIMPGVTSIEVRCGQREPWHECTTDETTIPPEATFKLKTRVTFTDGNLDEGRSWQDGLGYSSSDESVATVCNRIPGYCANGATHGTVTGVAAGTATITATYEGFSDSVVITVNPATATVTGLSLSASATTLSVGQTPTHPDATYTQPRLLPRVRGIPLLKERFDSTADSRLARA